MQKTMKMKQSVLMRNQEREDETNESYKGIETYYITERKLLTHILRLEKEKARKEIQFLLEYIIRYAEIGPFETIKYYLISLTSMVARQLERNSHMPAKAFAFNNACMVLIETKLKEENTLEFVDELLEFYMYTLKNKNVLPLSNQIVNNVILHISCHLESPITVEEVAKEFNISTSHLSRIFRVHTGVTLVEYINIRKVEESQYALRFTNRKISDISDQYHFCNQSYFTRLFKKYAGQTPREFRSNLSVRYFRFSFPVKEK